MPYQVHTVLTDNDTHFTGPGSMGSAVPGIRATLASGELFRAHNFKLACAERNVDHRLAKPCHRGPTARSSE